MIGKTVSHYKILEELGRGGMGIVYRAEDTKLHRTVALKFLPPALMSDASAKDRFMHEARAASALDHPNICTIHEIEETADGDTFIVMACYEGETLRDRIERGPLGIDEAIDIACRVAEGLDNAHGKAIVHRDIKPANIMLTTEGQVKIMDFGLAKLRGRTIITREGTTLGTVSYMSPEQARGEEIDRRTDIWAFGVLLFEILTGQRPFKGDYEQAVVYSILNEAPESLTGLRSGVPLELERIVNRCLDKDASDRYQTAGDLASDLGRTRKMLSSEPSKTQATTTLSAGAGKRRWWPWAAAFIAIALLVTVITILRRGPTDVKMSEPPISERKMIVVLPFENLGPPDDAYFADGITEEITSRLAVVSGLGVISRTSAVQYDRAGKTLKQIGADLGVDYVLEGTIRWNKQAAGGSRIRVTPQLIQVSDDTHIWAETYDRVLEDIFAVQSDIAGRIIEQLGITMLDRERDAVEVKPTDNLLAYEAYLRGLEVWSQAGTLGDEYLRAITLFQQAVNLDTTFALAYAKLSEAHGEVYFWGTDRSENRLRMAKAAADRALELEPDLPEAHYALGGYYYMGFFDYDHALKEYSIAIKGMPNNAALHASIAYIWRRQGLFQQALVYLERASTLDPTNSWYSSQVGITYGVTRQYQKAEACFDRSLALNPGLSAAYFMKALNILSWTGDMERAKATTEASQDLTHPMHIAAMWEVYIYEHDYQRALDCLSDLPTGAFEFGTTIIQREWLEGSTYMLLGDTARAIAGFDSARILMEEIVEQRPLDGAAHSALGLAYAGLGRKKEAIAAGLEGMEFDADDALLLPEREWDLALIYTWLGEYDSALDHIVHLLTVPSWISVSYLKVHPRMDPLRDNPRFKEILEKYPEDDS